MLFSLLEGRERRKLLKYALQYSTPAYQIGGERESGFTFHETSQLSNTLESHNLKALAQSEEFHSS